jgi:hypothetical protein
MLDVKLNPEFMGTSISHLAPIGFMRLTDTKRSHSFHEELLEKTHRGTQATKSEKSYLFCHP